MVVVYCIHSPECGYVVVASACVVVGGWLIREQTATLSRLIRRSDLAGVGSPDYTQTATDYNNY